MLYKLCKCGTKIPYRTTMCDECKDNNTDKKDKRDKDRYYDKTIRKSEDNKIYYDFYHSKSWQRLRLMCVSRDYGLCQDCLKDKKITTYNVVHHIISIKKDFNKRLDINNLICLCESCHQIRHKQEIK